MNLKKFTQKNADGSSFSYEFDVPKMQDIPDHPGEPKGTDTVPAWLTPGEFVVNAEATRMFEPQIEAMNEAGRAVQRAQGGSIPEYHEDGGVAGNMLPRIESDTVSDVPMELSGIDPKALLAEQEAKRRELIAGPGTPESLASLPLVPERDPKLQEVLDSTNPNLVPTDISGNINYLNSLLPEPSVESRLNQQQRARDLTPDGKSTSVDTDFEYIGTGTPGKFIIQPTTKTKTTKDVATGKTIQEIQNVINDPTATAETEGTSEKDATNAGIEFINNISQNDKFGQTSIDGKEIVRKDGDTSNSDKEEGAGFLSKVTDFFQEHFSDLIDSDKLMNAALLYVGSRALGHSHGGSLNFVGRTYLGEIQKKLQVADKAALSNKYTKESVKKYRDTGKVEDLEMKQNIQLEDTLSMVDRQTGRTIIVNKYKDANTGKVIHKTPDGQIVDMSKGRLVSQSDETARSKRFRDTAQSSYEAELKKLPDEIQAQFRERLPSAEAISGIAYDKARELNLDESKIATIIPSIFRQMKRDLGDDSINETAFQAYLDKQLVNLSLEDLNIKLNFDKVPAKVTDLINNKVKQSVPEANSVAGLSEFYRKAHDEFKSLDDDQKAMYKDKATGGRTAFLTFVETELDKLTEGN